MRNRDVKNAIDEQEKENADSVVVKPENNVQKTLNFCDGLRQDEEFYQEFDAIRSMN
ncbi:hypothetical protein Lbir_2225 [Legionella birminghamensis]|uniref:Uncharacterized protein n=1 Tax=Legionella birminghamensis TaxID=28083 RepID=A0A378I635_9GAMM|nr:hypothetical protein [Legionella birminghamensis]KTC68692.1 hypothetical protein Lbir_2225 [Legionella birminghamensis]STX30322.1 Uncharacterised protein [Legionella birminghamensis]